MAMIFTDGCDSYDTESDVLVIYDFGVGSFVDAVGLLSGGRFGAGALSCGPSGGVPAEGRPGVGKLIKPCGTNPGTDDFFFGVSFFKNGAEADEASVFCFGNSALDLGNAYRSTGSYNDHLNNFFVQLNTNGTFSIYCESDLLATSTVAYTYGSWARLEFRVAVADTGGVFEMRLNGTAIITFSGDTYRGAGPEEVSLFYFMSGDASPNLFDDVIVNDQTGTEFNTWQGDLRIDTLRPNGDVSRDSTVTGGTTANGVLDEVAADDADFVALTSAGDRDVLEFGNLPDTPDTIFGVVVKSRSRSNGTTGREYKVFTKDGVNEEDGETRPTPLSSFVYAQDVFANHPGGSAWTPTTINGINVGYEVVT